MYDIDGKTILAEIDTEVYFFSRLLDQLPSMTSIIRNDVVLNGCYELMRSRIAELYPDFEGEVEELILCAFGG